MVCGLCKRVAIQTFNSFWFISIMIRTDKFGKPILQGVFYQLEKASKILEKLGYHEETKNPNLFYRKVVEGYFYADMRGTKGVAIQECPVPLFYAYLNGPNWYQRRLWKDEILRLRENGCKVRLSTNFERRAPFKGIHASIDEEDGICEWPDGRCAYCGKDFADEGDYCSEECEEKHRIEFLVKCGSCGKPLELELYIRHHISYRPEKTMIVCRQCHSKIHDGKMASELRPAKEDAKEFYSKKPKKIVEKPIPKYCSRCEREISKTNKSGVCQNCRLELRNIHRSQDEKRRRSRLYRGYSY